jgi:hypothetical protein
MGTRRFRTSTMGQFRGWKHLYNDGGNFFPISVFYLLGVIPRILAPGLPGPGVASGPIRGNVMNAISIRCKNGGLLSLLATVLFLAAPAVRAQDQPQRVDQAPVTQAPPAPSAEDQSQMGQMPADPNAANMPAVDDNITEDDTHNPPSRVARISFTDGSVSLQAGGAGDWGTAQRNRPVTIGDKIWVDKDSRAELQAGQIAIHLGGMTALSFLNLDQNVTQIRLPEGKVNFRVREIRQGENYEVDTPNLAFTVKEAGAFRVDVNENGDFTSVTVIRGAGEIAASGQVYPIKAGERVDVTGTDGSVKVSTGPAQGPDPLDQWAQRRDMGEDSSPSAKYVNRDTVGYSDLDDYGTWKQDPQYGNVWTPNNESPDWAPYSDGNWAYVAPWGWSWVGAEPWGFAPYHYGRWVYAGGGWGWAPGPIYAYPFYGPAFVGWLGGGFGFGFGFGWGFGWFPLGWGEPFHPWYHCGYGYWRGINVHNAYFHGGFYGHPSAYNHFNYAYAHNAHAVTTASRSTFVNGQAVNRGAQHLSESTLRNAQVSTGGVHASPTRASSLGAGNLGSHVATPSSRVDSRSVTARSTPAAAASHSAVHTMNTSSFSGNRGGTSTVAHSMGTSSGLSASRESELRSSRPSYATQPGGARGEGSINSSRSTAGNSGRSWSTQGNSTDSGRGPQGFGSSNSNRPNNSNLNASRGTNSANRPPWAGTGNSAASQRSSTNRPPASYSGNHSYSAPSYGGNRSYSSPRSYSSAPRGNYSAPHYSAPHSSGGGGGSHGGGGGGGFHGGGGGGSHGGGGGHGGGGHR